MNLRSISAALSALLLIGMLWACTTEDPTPPPADTWTQEKLLKTLGEHHWRVQSVVRKSSAGTVDLTNDNTFESKEYVAARKDLLFWFRQGYVVFYSTQKLSNVGYADSVETIAASTKVDYPTIATYAWDEAKKTVVFSTGSTANSYIKFPLNQSSTVDKSSIRVYSTIEEAQAAKVHENLTLLSEDIDPVLGKVTYIFNLKPAWVFGGRPDVTNYIYYYAIF